MTLLPEYVLENPSLRLTFRTSGTFVWLESAENKSTEYDFSLLSNPSPGLWRIRLRSPASLRRVLTQADATDVSVSQKVDALEFTWNTSITPTPAEPPQNYDVTARIEIKKRKPVALFKLYVTPASDVTWSLFDVTYPALPWRAIPDSTLFLPISSGAITHEPTQIGGLTLGSPAGGGLLQTMQFLALSERAGGNMLYLATRDTRGFSKELAISGDPNGSGSLSTTFTTYPENHTIAAPFASAYGTELRLMQGDWYDAALQYRRWAVGRVATRTVAEKSPTHFQQASVGLSLVLCGDLQGNPCNSPDPCADVDYRPGIMQWRNYLGLGSDADRTVLLRGRLYDWQDGGGGEQFPDVPIRTPDLYTASGQDRAEHAFTEVYWNPTAVLRDSTTYLTVIAPRPDAPAEGGPLRALYDLYSHRNDCDALSTGGPDETLAFPNLRFPVVRNLHVSRLISEQQQFAAAGGGLAGVYLDVISGGDAERVRDYNRHLAIIGAATGGGASNAEGGRALAQEIRAGLPDAYVSTEYLNELYVDGCELANWAYSTNQVGTFRSSLWFLVPAYQTVFGRYQWLTPQPVLAFLGQAWVPYETAAYYTQALMFDAGALLGAAIYARIPFSPQPPDPSCLMPGATDVYDFFRILVEDHGEFRDFFRTGRRLRPVYADVFRATRAEVMPDDSIPQYYSGAASGIARVLVSAWGRDGGDVLLALVNWSDGAEPYAFEILLADYGFEPRGAVRAWEIDNRSQTRRNLGLFQSRFARGGEPGDTLAARSTRFFLLQAAARDDANVP